MTPKFDATISLGHILTAVSMIFTVVAAYFVLDSRVKLQEDRIIRVEQDLNAQKVLNVKTTDVLSEIKTGVAVIQDRLERSTTIVGPNQK